MFDQILPKHDCDLDEYLCFRYMNVIGKWVFEAFIQ